MLRLLGGMERGSGAWVAPLVSAITLSSHCSRYLLPLQSPHKVVKVGETRLQQLHCSTGNSFTNTVYDPIPQSWFKGVEKLLKQSDIVIKVA